MTEQIVAHTKAHETIDCPHCGIALCAHHPANRDTGDRDTDETCEASYYAIQHDCQNIHHCRCQCGCQAALDSEDFGNTICASCGENLLRQAISEQSEN